MNEDQCKKHRRTGFKVGPHAPIILAPPADGDNRADERHEESVSNWHKKCATPLMADSNCVQRQCSVIASKMHPMHAIRLMLALISKAPEKRACDVVHYGVFSRL